MKEPVDIITLNFNGLEMTKMMVKSLYKNTSYPFNLIIVDNASKEPNTKEYFESLKNKKTNIIIHYNKELDSGFAEGNNIGLKYAKSKYVLLLNNDILIPKKGWLESMVQCLERDKTIAIVGCKLLYPNGQIQHAGATFNSQLKWIHIGRFKNRKEYTKAREVPGVTFACALIRREFLKDGLDEGYWVGTYEDLDFCCTVRAGGYKIFYCPNAVLYHYESATLFKKDRRLLASAMRRNSRKFYKRWANWLKKDMNYNPNIYRVDNK